MLDSPPLKSSCLGACLQQSPLKTPNVLKEPFRTPRIWCNTSVQPTNLLADTVARFTKKAGQSASQAEQPGDLFRSVAFRPHLSMSLAKENSFENPKKSQEKNMALAKFLRLTLDFCSEFCHRWTV
jgi:hypothetical protein